MPRERINAGDLSEGSGVEGRRKRRTGEIDERNAGDESSGQKEAKKDTGKQFRRPQFKKDSEADIFDTSKQ
jgi:hypothetical protein